MNFNYREEENSLGLRDNKKMISNIFNIIISMLSVELLDHCYLNNKYRKLGGEKKCDVLNFQSLVLNNTGISLVNTLRKVIMDETDCYSVKNSLSLEHYEQCDSKGDSYFDSKYSDMYCLKSKNNFFESDSEYQQYRNNSGYAKIIRFDGDKEVYNGTEHTQILTEKLGMIPINSSLDYVIDATRQNKKVPIDQLWLFIGNFPKDQEKINNLNQITPIENTDHNLKNMNITVADHILVLYYDLDEEDNRKYWFNITRHCKPKKYNKLNVYVTTKLNEPLLSCNSLITFLKSGQKIKAHMRLERGTGRQYAKWLPIICYYKFATDDDIQNNDKQTDVNVSQRLFITNQDDSLINSVYINEPSSIILTLESIHKLNVPNVLYRAFMVIQHWLFEFRNNLMKLFLNSDVDGKIKLDLSENNKSISIDKYEYPNLVLKLRECNHNFIGLVIDYLIRYLVRVVDSDHWDNESDRGKFYDSIKNYSYKIKTNKPEFNETELKIKKSHLNYEKSLNITYHQIIDQLDQKDDYFINKKEIRDELTEFELKIPSFEDYMFQEYSSKLERSVNEKRVILKRWLEDTILAYRKQHPLRPEAYLTLKFPLELLNQINNVDLDKYFFDTILGQDIALDGKSKSDQNQQNFCKILYLVMEALNQLDHDLEYLKIQIMTKFNDKVDRTDLLNIQIDNYNYHSFLNWHTDFPYEYKNNTMLQIPYSAHRSHDGSPVREQRKLLLGEILFLSKFVPVNKQRDYAVIYAGAADGSHHLMMRSMFKELTFFLFDPKFKDIHDQFLTDQKSCIFSMDSDQIKYYSIESQDELLGSMNEPILNIEELSEHQYHIFPCYCLREIVEKLVKILPHQNLLFVSDLRTIPDLTKISSHQKHSNAIQQQIYDDNYLQYNLVDAANINNRLFGAMIKFRFPYKEQVNNIQLRPKLKRHHLNDNVMLNHNEFYVGEVYVQPYSPASTTESRLIIDRDNLIKPLVTYDDVRYENFFSYHNNIVRRSMRFMIPKMTLNFHHKFRLYHKFDHLLELYILNQYVTKYYQHEISHNQIDILDKIWDYLLLIEQDANLTIINWER